MQKDLSCYDARNYERLLKACEGNLRQAFSAFVPFTFQLSHDIFPHVFETFKAALQAADQMAKTILKSAVSRKYGSMSDREALACLKVHETSLAITKLLVLCAELTSGKEPDEFDNADHIGTVDPAKEAFMAATLSFRSSPFRSRLRKASRSPDTVLYR